MANPNRKELVSWMKKRFSHIENVELRERVMVNIDYIPTGKLLVLWRKYKAQEIERGNEIANA